MRLAETLAARFASRLLAFNVAFAVSSFSICARNSPLLGGGTRVGATAVTEAAAIFPRSGASFGEAWAGVARTAFPFANAD